MIKKLILILALISISGCGTAVQENSNTQNEQLNDDKSSSVSLEQIDTSQISLTIAPESLQIKEICRTPHDCTFRQRCRRMKLKLINHSDHDIKTTKVSRELISRTGAVERSSERNVPNNGYVIPADGEVSSTESSCSCRINDRDCTLEYPHTANPFLWQRRERVRVYYNDLNGTERFVEATGQYEYIKDE